jgi:hypothetical protein
MFGLEALDGHDSIDPCVEGLQRLGNRILREAGVE